MPYQTLSLGLTLTLPTNGTTNWGTTIRNTTWTAISQHQHTGSGDGAQMVTNSIADYAITTIKLAKDYGVTQAATVNASGTAATLNLSLGRAQFLNVGTASGNVAVTLSNPNTGTSYVIFITQGATPYSVTWPAAVKWPQGVAPILSTANGAVDFVWLYYDGTVYRGIWELDLK